MSCSRTPIYYDIDYDVTCPALWRWINFFLSVSPDDYRSWRLIQVFWHKYSFYIIVIRLEAWLTNWLTVNLLKKYKIKRKVTFFSKYQICFISWVENIEIFIRACTHENSDVFNTLDEIYLVFTSKKVNILYLFIAHLSAHHCFFFYLKISFQNSLNTLRYNFTWWRHFNITMTSLDHNAREFQYNKCMKPTRG